MRARSGVLRRPGRGRSSGVERVDAERRARRTAAAVDVGTDWVWPYWLERQLDPTSPAFVPRGELPFVANVTARNWTAVGNIGSAWEAIVDPRGLVTPWVGGWSLDWWIGADDRWHIPSREVAVRQRLVDDMPVVETAMRVPGGDAVQRVYGIHEGDDELVVVEIENRSRLPFAVALAIRPCNPEGTAVVERIGLHDTTVIVDGRVALLLPSKPRHAAASTMHDGDVASVVMAGNAGTDLPEDHRDGAGMATAAFLFPLPHTATLRVALPLAPPKRPRPAAEASTLPRSIPSAAQVASGWSVHARKGMRLELPDSRLASCVDAQRAFLLLLHDGDEITPGPATSHRFAFRDAAFMLRALDGYGYARESAEVLASYARRQRTDGCFVEQEPGPDANGAAIHAVGEHWRLHRDRALVDVLAPSIAAGAEWIERKRRATRDGAGELTRDLWSLRGLLDAAELLSAIGETTAAADASGMAAGLRDDLDRSLALAAARLGTPAMPAGPRRRIDAGVIGSLVAGWPLRVFAADDARLRATVDVIRERYLQGDAFFDGSSHAGLGTYGTLQLALVELEMGDRRALSRLDWMLGAATTTWTWPEAVHPRLPGGCTGDGHHGRAAADVLTFVRNLVVRDVHDGLALLTLVPDDWLGQGIEVHDAPTHAGLLSYAVRWHGDRPALLWELTPHEDVTAPVRITAPGLDPSWSSIDLAGEALLGPVLPPGKPVSLRRS